MLKPSRWGPETILMCLLVKPISLVTVTAFVLFTLLDPVADVANKPAGDTNFHALFDEEVWVLILINLFEVETVF